MGEILHTVRLPTKAVWTAGDHPGWQGSQHYAEEKPGRGEYCEKGKPCQYIMFWWDSLPFSKYNVSVFSQNCWKEKQSE